MTTWDNLRYAISASCGDLAAMVIIDNVPYLAHDLYTTFERLGWAVKHEPITMYDKEYMLATIMSAANELVRCADNLDLRGRQDVVARITHNNNRIFGALVDYEREIGFNVSME